MAWAPDYVELDEAKAHLGIDDDLDDAEIRRAIGAASRLIDNATNRQFGKTDTVETREYEVSWSRTKGLWVGRVDDIHTATGLVVTVNGSALASDAYRLLPDNAASHGKPWERIGVTTATARTVGIGAPYVTITATFGWSAVPTIVEEAVMLQLARLDKRRDAPFGVAGSPDSGSEVRLLDRLDADVALMVREVRRDAFPVSP